MRWLKSWCSSSTWLAIHSVSLLLHSPSLLQSLWEVSSSQKPKSSFSPTAISETIEFTVRPQLFKSPPRTLVDQLSGGVLPTKLRGDFLLFIVHYKRSLDASLGGSRDSSHLKTTDSYPDEAIFIVVCRDEKAMFVKRNKNFKERAFADSKALSTRMILLCFGASHFWLRWG